MSAIQYGVTVWLVIGFAWAVCNIPRGVRIAKSRKALKWLPMAFVGEVVLFPLGIYLFYRQKKGLSPVD